MIRIRVQETELRQEITDLVPDWLVRTEARTRTLLAEGAYREEFEPDEDRISWSEIKPVYRRLQGDKCIYCEKPLEAPEHDYDPIGAVEQDIEHYRPKAKTIRWRRRSKYPDQTVTFPTTTGRTEGYFWLAFEPMNYCASCKVCNSTLKGNRFPILGTPGDPLDDPAVLQAAERPLLFYPLSDIDEEPADHLTFTGYLVAPRPGIADDRRAKANIAFFLLNQRPLLQKGRASEILLAWTLLEEEQDGDATATARLDRMIEDDQRPYAACSRAFVALARANPATARLLFEDARLLLLGS